MRIVAVGAGNARGVHPALQERAPVVHLSLLLSVGVIERSGEKCGTVMIQERLSGLVTFSDLGAPCVTLRAHVDLPFTSPRLRSKRVAGFGVVAPGDAAAFVETDGQTLVHDV